MRGFLRSGGRLMGTYGRRFAICLLVALSAAGARLAVADEGGVRVIIGSAEGRQGEPAADRVNEPFAIDFDTQGVMYGVEFMRGNRVYRTRQPIDAWPAEGEVPVDFIAGKFLVTTMASDATFDASAPAPSALGARFHGMHDLAISDTRIFVADTFHHVLREVSGRQCHMFLLAGSGKPGDAGDGATPKEASFNEPYCCSLSPDGTQLLIADIRNHRLRAIDLEANRVTTLAGNGEKGKPVDGAITTESPLAGPRAACMADDGTVYLVLREGNALVAIRDGRLRTVVNASGKAGYGGDGGPGRDALLKGPKYVCMDRQGGVLIVDTENHCVRRYDPGTEQIDLVAGVPPKAGATVGDTWLQTQLRRPHGARIAPDGRLVIADSDNDRVLIGRYSTE